MAFRFSANPLFFLSVSVKGTSLVRNSAVSASVFFFLGHFSTPQTPLSCWLLVSILGRSTQSGSWLLCSCRTPTEVPSQKWPRQFSFRIYNFAGQKRHTNAI